MEAFKNNVLSVVYEYLGKSGTRLVEFLGDVVVAVLILIIGLKIAKHIVKLCERIFIRSGMDITLRTFLISFLKIGLKVLVIFMAVTKVGVASSSIIALIGSAGLALGLSLQGSLSNIAGGVLLLFLKPFKVGDYIVEGSTGKEGTVKSIGIMYTHLLSTDNQSIMVPNGGLSNSTITNVTFQDKRRIDILIGISYDESVQRVREVLQGIVDREDRCLTEEPIQIFVHDFADSTVDMGIRFWVKTEDYWNVRWHTLEQIKEEFDKNKISIPFPQMDVHIVSS